MVLIQKLLVCVRSKLLGLVFEELFKPLEGLLVCHEPLLRTQESEETLRPRNRRKDPDHCCWRTVEGFTCEWIELM